MTSQGSRSLKNVWLLAAHGQPPPRAVQLVCVRGDEDGVHGGGGELVHFQRLHDASSHGAELPVLHSLWEQGNTCLAMPVVLLRISPVLAE